MIIKNNNTYFFFLILVFSISFSGLSFCEVKTKLSVRGSGELLPRFVSLKHDEVYMRKGPSRDHPIDWVYKTKNLPLKIVSEFENWRKVIDSEGTIGWIHRSQLSNKRMVKVTLENLKIRSKPNIDAKVIAIAEIGALLKLERCDTKWCRLSHQNIKGWSLRNGFFGLVKDETP